MPLPLSTRLSQALVAYTIEFDDEAEQRIPHGTTVGGLDGMRAGGVWFTSQVMWTNFIRHIDTHGRPVREVQALACLSENAIKSRLHHLEWWHYVSFAPDPEPTRPKSRYLDQLVQLTPNGAKAAQGWAPISAEVDEDWRRRFGRTTVDGLRNALERVVDAEAGGLPEHMPVVDYQDGMRATLLMPDGSPSSTTTTGSLSSLLSRALLALTLEFEHASDISLTVAANVVRLVADEGTPLKEIALRAGVAKEGVVALVNFLAKTGLASLGTDKAKTVTLTSEGKVGQKKYLRGLAMVERHWEKAVGQQTIAAIRSGLDAVLGNPKLIDGLTPHAGSWRLDKRYITQTNAVLADPRASLPHHPMITHRGGFPDGC